MFVLVIVLLFGVCMRLWSLLVIGCYGCVVVMVLMRFERIS